MAKAHLTLPNGTQVTIEGTPEEVHRLLSMTGGAGAVVATPASGRTPRRGKKSSKRPGGESVSDQAARDVDLAGIVNLVKTCDEADKIEASILDRTSRVDRILLPLYILSKYGDDGKGLTSGEISKITKELGVPVSQPNTSTALSGAASKYVMGDRVRKRGEPVRYRISRRGLQYLHEVIHGKTREG